MRDTINHRRVGICGECGGYVTVPWVFMSVCPPVPTCAKCGRKAKDTSLPVLPMKQDDLYRCRSLGFEVSEEEGSRDGVRL